MKKFLLFFVVFVSIAVSLKYAGLAQAQANTPNATQVSPNVVISQIYGGGGSPSAQYQNDFVELFNRGASPINLSNWSVQYASAGGTNWLPAFPLPNFNLQPGQYFLLQFASSGAVGSPLPTPDFVVPVLQPEGFVPNLSQSTGKLAIVNNSTRLPVSTCPNDPSIVDLLGYGTSASCFESSRAPALTATTSLKRTANGCTDTDTNGSDFSVATPAPRNSSSPVNSCDPSLIQGSISVSPTTISPGGNILVTVTVVPAVTPPSTGIAVTGDLSTIGGSGSQTFFDDGTNGDTTAGDNVFSYLAAIPLNTTGGTKNISASVTDSQSRSVNINTSFMVFVPQPNEDPLTLGNPSSATADIADENNYLMPKPQYTLSYNRSKAEPNWVAWRLDTSWLGDADRQNDFRPDPALPAAWYHVQDSDYSGSGYNRGHMCPSGDRTNSIENNSATFLMTNFVPQTTENNQGPWEEFETYCRTLAGQGNELYIIDGPQGNIGTIAGGKIAVPDVTWKVVLILPNGSDDLNRVTKATRAFGIIVPNHGPLDINAPWRNFRVTVKAVEFLTGYNFFNLVPINTQRIIESRHDIQ